MLERRYVATWDVIGRWAFDWKRRGLENLIGREFAKRVAYGRGVALSGVPQRREIELFLRRFRENYVPVDLIRIGGNSDGGYLLPDIIGTVTHCFSPGVADSADFEFELGEKYGIKSFMLDGSVCAPPFADPHFSFSKRFLGSHTTESAISLSQWMAESLDGSEGDLILQMDIEGSEYEVLVSADGTDLNRFSVMVIEFHYLQHIFEKYFLVMLSGIFEKLYKTFQICHVHPNNCCGSVEIDGITVPRVMEITFLKTDLAGTLTRRGDVAFPHDLDRRNCADKPDLRLPSIWWQSGER